jgi:Na+-driven multidrug efflux pump
MGIVRIISAYGSTALAGNTIGIRIILFALLPSFGVSNAAATLVGQNLGAGKPDRAEAAAWKAGLYNTIFLGSVSLVFLIFAPWLIAIFTRDPEVAGFGVRCLRIVALGFAFSGYGMVLTQAFNGAGDTLLRHAERGGGGQAGAGRTASRQPPLIPAGSSSGPSKTATSSQSPA